MTNKEMMKKLFHEKLNQEKNRQRILERITSEPQKQVVYGKWLRTATAFMLVLVAACVLYGQRNQIASKDKEVIFHINEIVIENCLILLPAYKRMLRLIALT